jgi:hypothetical protein
MINNYWRRSSFSFYIIKVDWFLQSSFVFWKLHLFMVFFSSSNFVTVIIDKELLTMIFFSQVKIVLIPDQECLPSVVDYIKQSLELRKWGPHWSMHNFNYEYMTFLYVVHVYMFCNVVLYCFTRKGFICNKDYYYYYLFNWLTRRYL